MKNSLDDFIRLSCSIHAKLIETGVPAQEALSIAFGKHFADAAIDTMKHLNHKPKNKRTVARN